MCGFYSFCNLVIHNKHDDGSVLWGMPQVQMESLSDSLLMNKRTSGSLLFYTVPRARPPFFPTPSPQYTQLPAFLPLHSLPFFFS